ncbi:MAG: hypothetical protein KAS87_01720, partial [Candidatus Omnitrophica bacterium]|nr:hypothetical protein [Candidatus Omnitrophota bacterium]
KYEKPFFVADGQIHMPFKKNIEPIVEHLKPDFWSIRYTDIDLPPVDKSGDLNLLKNIILDCMQHLDLREEEKNVLLFAIDLGWPETELVNWKNYRIIGKEGDKEEEDKKRAMEILDIYNERDFGKLLRAAIRKIMYEVSTSSKAAREDALEILKAGVTPTRPHPKLKVLDALFASQPAQDYMGRTYHVAFKKSLLKFKLEKIFVSFIRSIPQNIEKKTNEIIKRKFEKVGWKVEKQHRIDGQNRFRFHVSYTFDDPKTMDDLEKFVGEFYDTLKEIYSYNTLNNHLKKGFYSKSEIWIKGVKLTVTFSSAIPIRPLKRSLAQHFGHYLYPYRGPEFEVIPYQTDFEEYSLNGLKKLNLYLYFPRPYDFLFDVKTELPFELDDKTRQAVDYCYLGMFHEAKTFLDKSMWGLTADEYILVGGIWNIDKAKEIYENLGIDFNERHLITPKYFIKSDLDEIRKLKEVNRRISESVDLFLESKDMARDAFEGDKEKRAILLREAQRLCERAYLPYPSNITTLTTIIQILSLEVKNDMKNVT